MNNIDNIEATWSDKYPCFCSGERQLKVNDIDFEDWIKENDWLLQEIINKFPNCKDKMKLAKKIYAFILKYDFRLDSYGKCI